MNRGERYDAMIASKENDELGCFEAYEAIMEIAQNQIRLLNPMRLYDLGCGTGNLCGPLCDQMKVMGVDFSMDMLMQANLKYPSLYAACYSIEDFMEELTVKPRDLFASAFVLHAIPDKARIFECFSKALKAGATVVIIDYFFNTADDKTQAITQYETHGRLDLADFLRSKHYLELSHLNHWSQTQAATVEFKWFTHWIGMAVIKPQAKVMA